VLGDPEGILVLSTYLYKLTNKLGTPSYHLMAAVAICIVAITFPLVLLQRKLLQGARKYATQRRKRTLPNLPFIKIPAKFWRKAVSVRRIMRGSREPCRLAQHR